MTGHRLAHPLYSANEALILATIGQIFDLIDQSIDRLQPRLGEFEQAQTQLTTMLTDGADQAAAEMALERGWRLLSPLPFGRQLNLAINSLPVNGADVRAMLRGEAPQDPGTLARARKIEELAARAAIFDLADQDERISEHLLIKFDHPEDLGFAQAFATEAANCAALAGRVVISQSDILIAVWDGKSTANPGGTGHTISTALHMGESIIWIDPARPGDWRFLQSPEALACLDRADAAADREATLAGLIRNAYIPDAPLRDPGKAKQGLSALYDAKWEDKSATLTHAYRKIETMCGGGPHPFRSVKQTYERPDQIGQGSGAGLLEAARKLPGADQGHIDRIEKVAMHNFAWADGISAHLSDRYRGGMVVNFLLSSIAIVGGIAYLPVIDSEHKWPFALFEFLLLLAIVIVTWRGVTYRLHGRWFETRRVAEYLRHIPFLLLLGIAHSPGRSPKGADTSWPEWIVRHLARGIGLPGTTINGAYLKSYLDLLLDCHVVPQRDYHRMKVLRLRAVHHNLDHLSELLFKFAIVSVAAYLLLKGGAELGIVDPALVMMLSKTFTVLGVMFPTFGGAVAGIRFFGDFERFAAISEVTYQRLGSIAQRAELLRQAPESEISYSRVAELAMATEDIVVSEIENWQAVFRGKQITVPV